MEISARETAAQPGIAVPSVLGASQFKLMYSRKEAAKLLSLSVRQLDYLIANGDLKVKRVGKRVLIPHQVLLQFARHDYHNSRVQ